MFIWASSRKLNKDNCKKCDTKMLSKFKISITILSIFLSLLRIGNAEYNGSATYISFVDGHNGFYNVYNENTGEYINYENYTFNISVGDKVIWVNEDSSDIVNLISGQYLWENERSTLSYKGRKFEYIFNDPGTYTFNLEIADHGPHEQTIIVNNISNNNISNGDISNNTMTLNMTPIHTVLGINVTNNTFKNITNEDNNISKKSGNMTYNGPSPILMPINIAKNLKKVAFICVLILILIFLIRG